MTVGIQVWRTTVKRPRLSSGEGKPEPKGQTVSGVGRDNIEIKRPEYIRREGVG